MNVCRPLRFGVLSILFLGSTVSTGEGHAAFLGKLRFKRPTSRAKPKTPARRTRPTRRPARKPTTKKRKLRLNLKGLGKTLRIGKIGKKGKAAFNFKGLAAALKRVRRRRWRGGAKALRSFVSLFNYRAAARKRPEWLTSGDYSKAAAERIARRPVSELNLASPTRLARHLYVLEAESSRAANDFKVKLRSRKKRSYRGKSISLFQDILAQAEHYHRLYDLPCTSPLSRNGTKWPPRYSCNEPKPTISNEPTAFVTLRSAPVPAKPLAEEAATPDKELKDKTLAEKRKAALARRDGSVVDHEVLEPLPKQFCVQGRCTYSTYADVARALYPRAGEKASQGLPVFCAPQRVPESTTWDTSKVHCSAQWTDTLGGWFPWKPESGEAAAAPGKNVIPPFACFGNKKFFSHIVNAPGGKVGSGFRCRRRVFRILATKAPTSQADVNQAIVQMCTEMRLQTWSEKYPNIEAEYRRWCQDEVRAGRRDASLCGEIIEGDDGKLVIPELPFMLLSREELLYFFGHRELFCRGDRKGLTHFLYNKEWAETFTCGVARGIIESGPFEEGVQVCAIAPFVGEANTGGDLEKEDTLGRLHCWKFNRPTCEDISKDKDRREQKYSIHRSNVFDAFDALKDFRRTRDLSVFELLDPKDVEKRVDWQAKLAFQDTAKDEGVFGVKQFCRFLDGSRRKIRCGYDKKTIARWYELHRDEAPQGCGSGVCARGAYKRGYFCGLFQSPELFGSDEFPNGKPFWMCGIDTGWRGRSLLEGAEALCVGGARARSFRSPKGDESSLQCYRRSFRWGESESTENILTSINWSEIVSQAAKAMTHARSFFDDWLAGGHQRKGYLDYQADRVRYYRRQIAAAKAKKHHSAATNLGTHLKARQRYYDQGVQALATAQKTFASLWGKDSRALVRWAAREGHTLGHRTSLWKRLLRSKIPVVEEFRKLIREIKELKRGANFTFSTLGPKRSRSTVGLYTTLAQPYTIGETTDEMKKEQRSFEPRSKSMVKEIRALVSEVVKGERPADDRWYQEIRNVVTEDFMLRIDPQQLAVLLRVHNLFEALDAARRVLLRYAARYAHAVFAAARKRPRLSRLELHEAARDEPISWRHKGNVFCTDDRPYPRPDGLTRYICASSPLLVAGVVELRALGAKRAGVPTASGLSRIFRLKKKSLKRRRTVRKRVQRTRRRRVVRKRTQPARRRVARPTARKRSRPKPKAKPNLRWLRSLAKKGARTKKKTRVQARRLRLTRWSTQKSARFQALREKYDQNRRNSQKLEWCYGGTRGGPLFGYRRGTAVLDARYRLGSPYAMDIHKRVAKWRKKGRSVFAFQRVNAINWLKCTGFQYSDATWAAHDPSKDKAPPKTSAAAGSKGGGSAVEMGSTKGLGSDIQGKDISADDRQKARDESGELMEKAGGLLKEVISIFVPELGKVIDLVEKASKIGKSFIDKWGDRLKERARKAWEAGKKKLKAFEDKEIADAIQALSAARQKRLEVMKKATADVEKAHTEYRNAAVAAAGGTPTPQVLKKREAKKKAYKEAVSAATKANNAQERAVEKAKVALAKQRSAIDRLREKVQNENRKMTGSGALLGEMLKDMIALITARLDGFVGPLVGDLVNKGFGYIRMILDPVVETVIKAIGAIPFAGGALAVVGAIAYKLALNALKDAITNALKKVVMNFLAKMVQRVSGPIFKAVKGQLQGLVRAACAKIPGVCPAQGELKFSALPRRDRWLNRALACRPRPVIDKRIYREARLARIRLRRIGKEMHRRTYAYVRGFVGRALARYGYTYDSWMKEASMQPAHLMVAKAARIGQDLRSLAARLERRQGKP